MGRELTCGQVLSSCCSMADHSRISSEMRRSLGRWETGGFDLLGVSFGVFGLLIAAVNRNISF